MVNSKTRLLLAIVVLLSWANPPPLIDALQTKRVVADCDWPMPGKDHINSRFVSDECGFGSLDLDQKWSYKYDYDISPKIIFYDNKVYCSIRGQLCCFNINTGQKEWSSDPIYSISNYFYICDNKIYSDTYDYPSDKHELICLDSSSGTLIWRYALKKVSSYFYLLSVWEDKAYFSEDNILYCIDLHTKSIIWSYNSKAIKKPIISDGCLYYPWAVCLDASTGEQVWKSKQTLGSSMAFADGKIYTRHHKSKYYILCLDAASGETIWEEPLKEFDKYLFPFSTECASVYNNKFFFFNKKTAQTKDTNSIYSFDLNTKKMAWSFDCGTNNVTEFTFYNGYLIFGMEDGRLMFISADTGEIKHQIDLGEKLTKR